MFFHFDDTISNKTNRVMACNAATFLHICGTQEGQVGSQPNMASNSGWNELQTNLEIQLKIIKVSKTPTYIDTVTLLVEVKSLETQ